jgi:hypothetical protein
VEKNIKLREFTSSPSTGLLSIGREWRARSVSGGPGRTAVQNEGGGDFEEEAAVAASVNELVWGRLAQGEPAQYERTRVVRNDLLAVLALLTMASSCLSRRFGMLITGATRCRQSDSDEKPMIFG